MGETVVPRRWFAGRPAGHLTTPEHDTDDRRTTVGLLDRLLGRNRRGTDAYPQPENYPPPSGQVPAGPGMSEDQRAIERYRYLLRTAPPDQIEEAHAEAFAKLTPDQRREVLDQLATTGERPQGDDPRSLARAATRAEVRHPGSLERAFGGGGYGRGYGGGYGGGYGPSFGSMVGGSLLGTIGGLVIGTAVADALFDTGLGDSGLFGGEDEMAAADGGDGFGNEDAGPGAEGDYAANADGGDYGGGDYGGGDFGGGDFGGGGDF
jgi:hypothetical protein